MILASGYSVLQLSNDHNINVQYQVTGSHNKLESGRFQIGSPVVWKDAGWLDRQS